LLTATKTKHSKVAAGNAALKSTGLKGNHMSDDNDPTPTNHSPQEPATQGVVVANKFTLTDPDGKQRIALFIEDGNAMLAFYDKDETPRFLIAVQPDGSALMSAIHRTDDDKYDDCFRLVISSGEPEMIMRDAIFKNTTVVSPRGFFASEGA
jgi:hypothetical protein